MAIKVTLRQKPLSKGRKSLYLDFYPPITNPETGKDTRREFLGLYIEAKPKNPLDKQSNKQTLQLGEQIRQKRYNELNKPEVYTEFELQQLKAREKGELSFIEYYENQIEKKKGKNYDVWTSSFNYIKEFTGGNLKFSEVTEKFCNDYREYLLNAKSRRSKKRKISQNTALSYFNKFKATLKQAFKDGILQYDLNSKIATIKEAETNRVFLTMEELNKLANTDCVNPVLKKAALFSSLTGLRFSDIEKLKWSEFVSLPDKGYYI
ncbi:MAG TPA: integrase, partial [Flavobacteriaceae bacterium]|nr:integrase [Flavobacteriaceae bacterium]